ncbi:potassium channel family protein [Flavobacterium sp. HXWNR69]|uniref:Potassium channel family protein n=1 Tax=Flavobacterium fragile TaxID=2949085 RepID=A0ABT0TJ13_9FLAO|nr:potassium channel family protein [Flavobacterium sp. HXWNR69]MCL9770975.1 potassium channel family protein [Flavobacterium sp. HXWNR69]
MSVIKKLLVGKVNEKHIQNMNPVKKRLLNIKAIWNNDHEDDNGIEKIIRLILSTSQLLFPGIYIKYWANKFGHEYKDLAMDFYILAKVTFPLLILINNWQNQEYIIYVLTYFLLETVLYIPTLIFASDLFSQPRSYKRSMLLLFFNYLETVLAFAVFYRTGNYLNAPLNHWFDAVYYSFVTSSTIGYGEFYPTTTEGKIFTILQVFLFLFFVILFMNFFSSKIKTKGYFSDNTE